MKNDNNVAGSKPPIRQSTMHKITSATGVHTLTQKSKTLYRRAVQNPVSHSAPLLRKVGRSMDIARSKSISHFAVKPPAQPLKSQQFKKHSDISPIKRPVIAKPVAVVAVPDKTAKDIKEQAIAIAFDKLADHQEQERKTLKQRAKTVRIIAMIISLVLLILIGYFIYLNIPSLSVRVAAAQAGISATYPEYLPDGYGITGLATGNNGQVTIKFHSSTDNSKFIIKQSKTLWDSSALQVQVVKDSNNQFVTTKERGLTIYTHGNNANWVNGGILYAISGDATLSGDQIRRIATSL